MPTYDFINENTGEIFEDFMSISECDQYLKENPHIRKYFGSKSVNFIDNSMLGRQQPDGKWFDLIDKIKRKNPNNTMENSRFHRSREW